MRSKKEISLQVLKRRLAIIFCIAGTIGISLKFLTFQIVLNQHLYGGDVLTGAFFPYFPNVLDSLFLTFSILAVSFFALKRDAH